GGEPLGAVTMLPGVLLDVRQPGPVALLAAADDSKEEILEAARHGTGGAVPDTTVVELADGSDLDRRAGEECLVGQVHLVAREAFLARRDAEVAEQPQHRLARDAPEHGGERR